MNVTKFWKENIKVFMEYGLFEINDEKMIIFLAQLLSENLWSIQSNMCLLFYFV
jgi:hypothetical protein